MYTLISIRFSHYVEKVRWLLDLKSLPYNEIPLMPVSHFFVTPWHIGLKGKRDGHSTMFSTPILKDQNRILIKSTTILPFLDQKHFSPQESLYFDPRAREMDEYFTNYLGPHTRRLFYLNVLNNEEEIRYLAERNVSRSHALLFNSLFKIMRYRIVDSLKVNEEKTQKSIGYIYKEFEKIDKVLGDGRPFLLGDRMSAADISFATMGGAIVLPSPQEGYGAFLPPLDGPDNTLRKIARDLRQSAAGQWALDMYRCHRGTRAIPAKPFIQL